MDVGIDAETLSSDDSSGGATSATFAVVFLTPAVFDVELFAPAVAFAEDSLTFAPDDDVFVEPFTVAGFVSLFFEFVFETPVFVVFSEVFADADFADADFGSDFVDFAALRAGALTDFAAALVGVFVLVDAAVLAVPDFAAGLELFAAAFAGAFLATVTFSFAEDALEAGLAPDLEDVPLANFLAAAVTFVTPDLTPPAFVADFLDETALFVPDVAALGMRSTSWRFERRHHSGPTERKARINARSTADIPVVMGVTSTLGELDRLGQCP